MPFFSKIKSGFSKIKQENLLLCYNHLHKRSNDKCYVCNYCYCSDCLVLVGEKEAIMCIECLESKKSNLKNTIYLWIIYLCSISLLWLLALIIVVSVIKNPKNSFTQTNFEITAVGVGCYLAFFFSKKEIQNQKNYKTAKPYQKI
jgi:hypothetical protein